MELWCLAHQSLIHSSLAYQEDTCSPAKYKYIISICDYKILPTWFDVQSGRWELVNLTTCNIEDRLKNSYWQPNISGHKFIILILSPSQKECNSRCIIIC
jgi:hypothetical protein